MAKFRSTWEQANNAASVHRAHDKKGNQVQNSNYTSRKKNLPGRVMEIAEISVLYVKRKKNKTKNMNGMEIEKPFLFQAVLNMHTKYYKI